MNTFGDPADEFTSRPFVSVRLRDEAVIHSMSGIRRLRGKRDRVIPADSGRGKEDTPEGQGRERGSKVRRRFRRQGPTKSDLDFGGSQATCLRFLVRSLLFADECRRVHEKGMGDTLLKHETVKKTECVFVFPDPKGSKK